ncbi:glycosyltransferase [Nocardioides sp. CN2-186]|uniref:glycosyltransferase family 4 protein n=1 Tax=Nocardioides tweenelious TaxID=3156607 RepID=UPI0032B3366A
MRIVHVSDCYRPRMGGIELHLGDLVEHQRAAGDDARIVTSTPAGELVDDPWVHRLDSLWDLRRVLDDLAPDIVHVHVSVLSPLATLAARRAASTGVPTLVTVHSMWSRLGPLPATANLLLRLRGWPITWSAVSSAAAAPLRTMLGPDVPVRVLPNAIDADRWQGRCAPDGAVPTVVSVMRMTHTKRTLPLARILLDVRRQLPADRPLRALVVGDGPQRAALERFVRRHDMTDWVELPGRLDRSEIRRELARSSVYLAPAELESFGIAALEARTAGLPVVASSHSGVTEFVTHLREGLLGETDAALAAHVTRLLADDALRTTIARHNATTRTRHDWAAVLRRTQDLYLEAASARVPRLTLVGST